MLNNQENILAAIDAIDKSVRALAKFGERYNQHIDEAALCNDTKRVKQLIWQKLGVNALIEQLTMLKVNVEHGALTSKIVRDMGKLLDAIVGCKGLLSEYPKLKSLGESIKKIFKDMQRPAEEISNLNDIFDAILSPMCKLSEMQENDVFKAEFECVFPVSPRINARECNFEEAKKMISNVDWAALIEAESKK